jgi:hypothetical protein
MRRVFAGLAGSICLLFTTAAPAATRHFKANMDGAQEVPAVATTATGTCNATLDDVTGAVTFSGTFTGLSSNANNAHIHGLAPVGMGAGVIVPASSFTAGTSGIFGGSGTLSPANIAGMIAGQTYCNVHSINFGAGEIRGQLTASPVPSMGTWGASAFALGLAATGAWLLMRRRQDASL